MPKKLTGKRAKVPVLKTGHPVGHVPLDSVKPTKITSLREPTLAASRVEPMSACPGFVNDPWTPPSAAMEEGTLLHGCCEDNFTVPEGQPPEYYDWVAGCKALVEENFPEPEWTHKVELPIRIPYVPRDNFIDRFALHKDGIKAGVIDWKFGQNKQTPAEDNMQGMGYVVGILWKYPRVMEVEVVFHYPKLDYTSTATFNRGDMLDYLTTLAEIKVKSKEWPAHLETGDHCEWCGRKTECPAMIANIATARSRMDDWPASLDPSKLVATDGEDMRKMLKIASLIEGWAKSVRARAYKMVNEEGFDIPGFEMVTVSGKRSLQGVDHTVAAVVETLEEMGMDPGYVTTEKVLEGASIKVGHVETLLKEAIRDYYGSGKIPRGAIKNTVELFNEIAEANGVMRRNDEFQKLQPIKRKRLKK